MRKQPEQAHGICLLRDLSASWSALMLDSNRSGMSLHQGQMKRSRIKIVISGYKLNQEAQLLNERFDLNTGINPINLPSIGVHTSLAQVYPTLGGSSIINQGFSSCPRPHKEEPHKKDRIASHVLMKRKAQVSTKNLKYSF